MNFQFQKKKFEKNSRVELQSIFRGAKIDEYPLKKIHKNSKLSYMFLSVEKLILKSTFYMTKMLFLLLVKALYQTSVCLTYVSYF